MQSDTVALARNALAVAKAAGVGHIVRSSGAGADCGLPITIGRVQGEIDQLVIESGIPYTITRPNCFMQNCAGYYAVMIRSGALYLPQGDGKVSFIDVRDIAVVNAVLLRHPADHAGRIYELTGGEALSNAEVVAPIGAAWGLDVNCVPVTDDAAIASMRESGTDAWTIDTLMSLNRLIASGYAAGVSPDVQTLLGRAPIAFARFVADYIESWR